MRSIRPMLATGAAPFHPSMLYNRNRVRTELLSISLMRSTRSDASYIGDMGWATIASRCRIAHPLNTPGHEQF